MWKKRDQSSTQWREKQLRNTETHECKLYHFLMFILSEVAGVSDPQPCRASLARSQWLCGSTTDKTVMKPNGNNTDHQRKPLAR